MIPSRAWCSVSDMAKPYQTAWASRAVPNPDAATSVNVVLETSTMQPNVMYNSLQYHRRETVILVYDRTSTSTDVNKARKKLFAKTSSVQRIPPTYCSSGGNLLCEQHYRMVALVLLSYDSVGQTLVLPSSESWGWTKTDVGLFVPYWSYSSDMCIKTCYPLISCGSKKVCKTQLRVEKS